MFHHQNQLNFEPKKMKPEEPVWKKMAKKWKTLPLWRSYVIIHKVRLNKHKLSTTQTDTSKYFLLQIASEQTLVSCSRIFTTNVFTCKAPCKHKCKHSWFFWIFKFAKCKQTRACFVDETQFCYWKVIKCHCKTSKVKTKKTTSAQTSNSWFIVLNFMQFFWKIWQNLMLTHSPEGLAPPPTGNPGSASNQNMIISTNYD